MSVRPRWPHIVSFMIGLLAFLIDLDSSLQRLQSSGYERLDCQSNSDERVDRGHNDCVLSSSGPYRT